MESQQSGQVRQCGGRQDFAVVGLLPRVLERLHVCAAQQPLVAVDTFTACAGAPCRGARSNLNKRPNVVVSRETPLKMKSLTAAHDTTRRLNRKHEAAAQTNVTHALPSLG